MARGEFQIPTLTHVGVYGGTEFIRGSVPSLTPETYNPILATQELEEAAANAHMHASLLEVQELEEQFSLELGGDF